MISNSYVSLLLFTGLMAAGQMLFKISALRLVDKDGVDKIWVLALLPQFWFALVIYGSATVLWIFILQYVPLSRAYAFVSLAFVLVPILSYFFLGETITPRFAVGVGLVVIGVYISSTS